MKNESGQESILLTGATGFIGRRLLPVLLSKGLKVACLARSSAKMLTMIASENKPEVVEGNLLDPDTLDRALEGRTVAYYLVHSMGGRRLRDHREFAERDRQAATHFIRAAEKVGLKRIIYLGGLGETGDKLSEHLSSRLEVARILQSRSLKTTVLRAAIIIGAGGASFEMLRYLVERLPVMVCPKWIETRSQPIAVQNALDYLAGCLDNPATAGLTLDIGGPDILTYRELMLLYARVRNIRRLIITVPVLTPRLSSYWINLVTPVPAGIAMPLVQGLRNTVVCRDDLIRSLIPVNLISMERAIREALELDRSLLA